VAFLQHAQAIVESPFVGEGTTVCAFAHILARARIGRDCNICDHTFIENDVVVGDRVTIKHGVQLWDGTVVEDDVFIGPNATFTDDPFPRSKQRPREFLRTIIKKGASIGANATILPGLTVGEHAMIGAGAVLTHNAPARAILVGNPARIKGYADVSAERPFQPESAPRSGSHAAEVEGVVLHRLPLVDDVRGMLSFGEYKRQVPFPIKRYFLVFGVSSKDIRGEHAHRTLHQFLVCVHGRCNVVVDDGTHRQEFILDSPSIGVYVPPMVWAVQYQYSPDAVLLVLASDYYDAQDYVRDYPAFLVLRQGCRDAPAEA
jgi:acetyltransferase-like isoleucine patch superfamily enzyme/dTDP-4-dehydrorhamnose 3,5-epimerase-like enzyme